MASDAQKIRLLGVLWLIAGAGVMLFAVIDVPWWLFGLGGVLLPFAIIWLEGRWQGQGANVVPKLVGGAMLIASWIYILAFSSAR